MTSSTGMADFSDLDIPFDDWFGDEAKYPNNDVGAEQTDYSAAVSSMALNVPLDDGTPMLQALNYQETSVQQSQQHGQQQHTFIHQQQHQQITQQQSVQQQFVTQPQEDYHGHQQNSQPQFETLQPYEPVHSKRVIAQSQQYQQQPQTSSNCGQPINIGYVGNTLESNYINCQPTTSAAPQQNDYYQQQQPPQNQRIQQSQQQQQNVEYRQTGERQWIMQQNGPQLSHQQNQNNVTVVMSTPSSMDSSMQYHGGQVQLQQQESLTLSQQSLQQVTQQFGNHQSHQLIEMDNNNVQHAVVYAQQQPQTSGPNRIGNNGQDQNLSLQHQIMVPQQQRQQHVMSSQIRQQVLTPGGYTQVVEQNGQQITYMDQRQLMSLGNVQNDTGNSQQQQMQYVQTVPISSANSASGATYHILNGGSLQQIRVVSAPAPPPQNQPMQMQQQQQQTDERVQRPTHSLGQPPPQNITPTSLTTIAGSNMAPSTVTAAPSRSKQRPAQSRGKKNNSRAAAEQKPIMQKPPAMTMNDVMAKMANLSSIKLSKHMSDEFARLGALHATLQAEQDRTGQDMSSRLNEVCTEMVNVLSQAEPVASSPPKPESYVQQQPAKMAPPTAQSVGISQAPPAQQAPPAKAPPKRNRKKPPPKNAPKPPAKGQQQTAGKATQAISENAIQTTNMIYVDANGQQVIPVSSGGTTVYVPAASIHSANGDIQMAHSTLPSTSYGVPQNFEPPPTQPAVKPKTTAAARRKAAAPQPPTVAQHFLVHSSKSQSELKHVPTSYTIMKQDPLGASPPPPIDDAYEPPMTAPSPKREPLILPLPAVLAANMEQKRNERKTKVGEYLNSLKDSLERTDYFTEFSDKDDAVSRLLPFSLLVEPNMSDSFLDQFDHEMLRHSTYMADRRKRLEAHMCKAFYKESMGEKTNDHELTMLLALDVEYERRQLEKDKEMAKDNLERFVRQSEFKNTNENELERAKAALKEELKSPKKSQLHFEYHEFDEERYKNISPLPTTPPPYEWGEEEELEYTDESDISDSTDEEERASTTRSTLPDKARTDNFEQIRKQLVTSLQPPMINQPVERRSSHDRPKSQADAHKTSEIKVEEEDSEEPKKSAPSLTAPSAVSPRLSPQSEALRRQSHLPLKLRMKNHSMLKSVTPQEPERSTQSAAPFESETIAEASTSPITRAPPLERPIATVRPMEKAESIQEKLKASFQRIADLCPQSGPKDATTSGTTNTDVSMEHASWKKKKSKSKKHEKKEEEPPRLTMKICLPKKTEQEEAQQVKEEADEEEEKARKRRRKDEKKERKKERKRLREVQALEEIKKEPTEPPEKPKVATLRIPRPMDAREAAIPEVPIKMKLNLKHIYASQTVTSVKSQGPQDLHSEKKAKMEQAFAFNVSPEERSGPEEKMKMKKLGKRRKEDDEDSDWEKERSRGEKQKRKREKSSKERKLPVDEQPSTSSSSAKATKVPKLLIKLGPRPKPEEPQRMDAPTLSLTTKPPNVMPSTKEKQKTSRKSSLEKVIPTKANHSQLPSTPLLQKTHIMKADKKQRVVSNQSDTNRLPSQQSNDGLKLPVRQQPQQFSSANRVNYPPSSFVHNPSNYTAPSGYNPSQLRFNDPHPTAQPSLVQSAPYGSAMPTMNSHMAANPSVWPSQSISPPSQQTSAYNDDSYSSIASVFQEDPNFPMHGASGFDDVLARKRVQFSPCSDDESEEMRKLQRQTSDLLKKLGGKPRT